MSKSNGGRASWIALILVFFFYVSFVMALWEWTDRNVEYVCSEIKGRPVKIHGFYTLLIACSGPVAFVFNVGTEIYAAIEEEPEQASPAGQ